MKIFMKIIFILGIPVIEDLPVGKKMYDHGAFVGVQFYLNESITIDAVEATANIKSYTDYIFSGKGILTSTGNLKNITTYLTLLQRF